ncbi:MAG: hypothetical protein WCD70_13615 [Alphaproteobacteria bacterium]
MLEKILGLASIGGLLSSFNLSRKFVISLATVIALTIVAAIIASALILFGLYEFYELLMRHGMDDDNAALLAAFTALLALIFILTRIACKVKHLQAIPFTCPRASSAASSVISVLQGFYRGLTEKRPS